MKTFCKTFSILEMSEMQNVSADFTNYIFTLSDFQTHLSDFTFIAYSMHNFVMDS